MTLFGTVMQIAQTKADMLAVVEALRQQLGDRSNAKKAEERIARARREVERIRKELKRRIDRRARYKAGEKWFSVHAREGIERELAEATAEALAAVAALAQKQNRTSRST